MSETRCTVSRFPNPQPLSRDELLNRLRCEGAWRYHDLHPFHIAMHDGQLDKEELQRWVINRYYYQTRIPIKDALIVAKSEDPAFRRKWLRRITDHDGAEAGTGGLELWLRLGEALGVDRARMESLNDVLPGVRFACDAYVTLVREASLVVAVASSLTEFFAPDLMSRRIAAFEEHYAFVNPEALSYFRQRVPRAQRDANEAMELVLEQAISLELQEACIEALIKKTQILWSLLDCVQGTAQREVVRASKVQVATMRDEMTQAPAAAHALRRQWQTLNCMQR